VLEEEYWDTIMAYAMYPVFFETLDCEKPTRYSLGLFTT